MSTGHPETCGGADGEYGRDSRPLQQSTGFEDILESLTNGVAIVGLADLAQAYGVGRDFDEPRLVDVRRQVARMAVIRGQDALDGVHLSFDVDSTLLDSCQLSRELGFRARLCCMPARSRCVSTSSPWTKVELFQTRQLRPHLTISSPVGRLHSESTGSSTEPSERKATKPSGRTSTAPASEIP